MSIVLYYTNRLPIVLVIASHIFGRLLLDLFGLPQLFLCRSVQVAWTYFYKLQWIGCWFRSCSNGSPRFGCLQIFCRFRARLQQEKSSIKNYLVKLRFAHRLCKYNMTVALWYLRNITRSPRMRMHVKVTADRPFRLLTREFTIQYISTFVIMKVTKVKRNIIAYA